MTHRFRYWTKRDSSNNMFVVFLIIRARAIQDLIKFITKTHQSSSGRSSSTRRLIVMWRIHFISLYFRDWGLQPAWPWVTILKSKITRAGRFFRRALVTLGQRFGIMAGI